MLLARILIVDPVMLGCESINPSCGQAVVQPMRCTVSVVCEGNMEHGDYVRDILHPMYRHTHCIAGAGIRT